MILNPLVALGAYYQRLKRHYNTSSTSNRMPGPGTQTSTYHGMLTPGVVGSRNGDISEPTAVDIFLGERRMYRAATKRQSPPPFMLNRRKTRQNRCYEDGDGKGGGVSTSSPSALHNV